MKLRNWRPSSNLASAIGSVSSRAIAVLPRRLTARPRVPYKPSSTSLAVFLLAGVTVALLAWGLHTGLGRAATALDVATVSNQNGCNPCTWSHTVTSSGSNRILVVAITHNAGQFINGVTYAGETLTNVRTDSNGSFAETSIWYQVNPATGTNTISVAFSAAPTASFFISYSLTGVDQASPIDANNGANGGGSSQPSVTVTTIAPGAWIIDAVYVRDTTLTMVAKSGRTQRMNAGTGPSGASSTLEATTATSYTMNWTKGANMQWAETVVSLKPSGQSFSESLSDAATVAQSVASALGFSRADTATLAESVLTGLPAADSALLSDSLSVVMGMSQSDLVGLADTTLGTVTRGLVDVVGVLAPAATGLQFSEAANLVEVIQSSLSRAVSEPATLSDSLISALGIYWVDSANLVESVATGLPQSDTAAINESMAAALGFSRNDVSPIVHSVGMALGRGVSDAAILMESASIGLFPADTAGVIATLGMGLGFAPADSQALTDLIRVTLASGVLDTASLTENSATGLLATDAATISAVIARGFGYAVSDWAVLGESILTAASINVADSADIQDLVGYLLARSASETTNLSQWVGAALGLSQADWALLTESVQRAFLTGVTDYAILMESAALGLSASDTAVLSDVLASGLMASDTANLVGLAQAALGLTATDTAGILEWIQWGFAYGFGESASLADSVAIALGLSLGDGATLAQSLHTALGLGLSDSASLSEWVQRGFGLGIGDSTPLIESLQTALVLVASDTAALSEWVQWGFAYGTGDAALLAESVAAALGLSLGDSTALAQSLHTALGLSLGDSASLSEWVRRGFGLGIGDAALLAESVAAALGLSLGDSTALAQSLHTALGLSLGDSASLSEWVRRGFSYGIGDAGLLADSVAAALGLSLGDGAALAQSLRTALALGLSDGAGLSEWVQRGFGLGIGDAAPLVDSVAAALGLSLGDSATLAQSLRTALALGLSDTASLSEWVQRGFGLGIGDAGLLADSVAAALGLSLGDSAALAQSLHTALALGLSDGASLSEWVQRGFSSGIGDAAPLVESLQTALALTTADSPSLSEWVQRGFGFGTGDSATLAQALQTALGLVAGDSAALSEWVQQGFGLGMSDAAPLVDSVAAALGISRTESAALKDSVNLAISPIIPGGSLLVDFVTLGQVRAIDTSMSELVSGSAAIGSTVQARPTEITASNLAIGKSDATGLAGLAATAFPLRESTALLETVAYSATSSPAGSADLSVQQAAVPGPVPADRNITYIIQVVNHGPSAATQVSLESIADSSLLLLAVSADSGTCDANLNVVTCNLGTLGINETVEVRIHARIPQVAGISSITNVVNVSAHQSDPVTDNNTSVLATLALPQAQGDGAQASDSYQGSPGHPEFDLLIQATQPELVDLEEILRSDRIMNIRVTDRPFGVINNADASGSFRLVLPASVVGPSSLQFSDFEAALGTLGLRHSGGRWSITLRLDDEITVNGEGTMVVGPLGSLELLVVPTTLVFEPQAPDAEMLDGGHPSVTEIGARFVVELKQLPMEVTLAATYAKDIAGLLEYASDKLALLAASLGAEGGAAAVQVAYAVKVDAAGAGGDVLGSNEVSFSVSRSWIEDEVSRANRIVLAKFGRSGDPLLPPGDVTRGCRASSSGAPMVTCTAIFSGSQGGFSTFVLAAIEDGSGAIPVPYDPPATTPAPDPDVGTAPDAAKPDGSTGAKELPSSEQLEILPAGREPQPGAAPWPPPVQRESPGQAGRWGSGLLIAVPAILTLLVGISGLLLIRRFRAKPGEAGS